MKKTIFALMTLLGILSANAEVEVTAQSISGKPGDHFEILVFASGEEIYSFETVINLDPALALDAEDITLNSERAPFHVLTALYRDKFKNYKFTVFDTGCRAIPDSDELHLYSFPITIPEEEGQYEIEFLNQFFCLSVDGMGDESEPDDFSIIVESKPETGIDAIVTDGNANDEWYGINGIRYTRPGHGIYIHRLGDKAVKEVR